MATEVKTENVNWTNFVGTTLGGMYVLERLASAEEGAASFLTRTGGEHSAKAVLRLVRAEGDSAERQMEIWQGVKKWEHPHLLQIWGTGRTNVEGQDYIYVVAQAPDENLAGVLADRPLEPAEAGEILASLVSALGHLHAHRMVHGSVSPEQIFAVGETVKLSTQGVRRFGAPAPVEVNKPRYTAPEAAEGNITPAADIWCVGATLVEAFTQQGPWEDYVAEAAKLPAPFHEIAQICLQREPETRGTLPQILDLYEGKVEAKPAVPKRIAAAAGVGVPGSFAVGGELPAMAGPEAIAGETETSPGDEPPVADAVAEPKAQHAASPEAAEPDPIPVQAPRRLKTVDIVSPETIRRAKFRAWIFVAITLAFLLAVVWAFRPKATHQAVTSSSPAGQKGTSGGVKASRPEASATPPAVPAKTEQHPATQQNTSSLPAKSGPIWKVILYTYNRAEDAEKRAATINRLHPGLGATVFAPKGEGKGPYLVVIGATTNRDQALQLRKKAIQDGLPRDAYLQNYDR